MIEYLGLSGSFDSVDVAFSELTDASWFWPAVCIGVVVIVLAARR
jgi:hypothetical protein